MWTPREEVGSGMDWETEIDVYTLPCIKWIANEHLLYGSDLYSALCGDKWEGNQKQGVGSICIHIADSFCYTVENNTALLATMLQ